ncbi:MAG: hypothetical protein WCG97_00335 [bacterium]
MDYLTKILRRISIKSVLVHIIALSASIGVIWGISYLILVTFSIQDSAVVVVPASEVIPKIASNTASSTLKNSKKGTGHATSTSSSTKSKK